MTKPMIKIHNLETGEVVEREMTNEELEQLEADRQQEIQIATEIAQQQAAKAALLEKLGITADEAALLIS